MAKTGVYIAVVPNNLKKTDDFYIYPKTKFYDFDKSPAYKYKHKLLKRFDEIDKELEDLFKKD
jgi:hypothetical protein